jgi:predicted AAA+ superfamily ATPase
MMWIERDIAPALTKIAAKRPVLLLTGARQTGKTSLCRRTFPGYDFVSLDLPNTAEEAELSGEEFLARHKPPLIIDEVQYAPALFRYLKSAVDKRRSESGLYILTGSQKFTLMSGLSESLAGRAAVVDLNTLSLHELETWSSKTAAGEQLLEWMIQGGYPELHAKGLEPERFYSDYVATYLERDVRQVLHVRSLRDFNRFMRLIALRTGQLLSMNSLAADVGVSPNTVRSWLSVLEASQIIYLLEPYHRNLGKRIVKSPKLYFLDTGLACFLTGLRSSRDLKESALLGPMFETLALGQVIRWYGRRARSPNVFFYRDHYGSEVDFVIPVGTRLKLYECKWAERQARQVGRNFDALTKLVGERNIISRSVITPVRGSRRGSGGALMEDCVVLGSLET